MSDSKLSLVYKILENGSLVTAGTALTSATLYLLFKNKLDSVKAINPYGSKKSQKLSSKKSLVNKIFFRRLIILVRIAVPGLRSAETRLLIVFSLFLVARTYLSVRISDLNGFIVKSIVSLNRQQFISSIFKLAMITIPASVVNSMLKFLLNRISFKLRSRLVRHFNKRYLASKMSYKVANVDSRISNPDQILTTTISEWSEEIAGLYSSVTKPILDIILFSKRLSEVLGWKGPICAFVYYSFSAVFFRLFSPLFGKMTARMNELEGEYRKLHSRILNYAEPIAFYRGNEKEKQILTNAFNKIKYHKCFMINKDYYAGLMHGFISKYGSFLTAYSVLGFPVFAKGSTEYLEGTKGDRSVVVGDYIRNSNLYINLALAIGKIVVSYNSLQKLSGHTMSIYRLQEVLSDLEGNFYVRGNKKIEFKNNVITDCVTGSINFENLSIITPNNDVLSKNLNFEIQRGMNVLITGPNGCGKSSLFRILSGLWPVFEGRISKPRAGDIFYIPQKPYLTKGTLIDQIIYPKSTSEEDFDTSNEEIKKIMDLVKITYIINNGNGGLNEIKDWSEVLSGGEKQQIALARLIYNRPLYAIMDECTSSIAFDLEKFIYSYCHDVGITLITVSHRRSLWPYHEFLLEFDGSGGWKFEPMAKNAK